MVVVDAVNRQGFLIPGTKRPISKGRKGFIPGFANFNPTPSVHRESAVLLILASVAHSNPDSIESVLVRRLAAVFSVPSIFPTSARFCVSTYKGFAVNCCCAPAVTNTFPNSTSVFGIYSGELDNSELSNTCSCQGRQFHTIPPISPPPFRRGSFPDSPRGLSARSRSCRACCSCRTSPSRWPRLPCCSRPCARSLPSPCG